MHSGHLCLELTAVPRWHEFPLFAKELVSVIGASVVDKKELVDMHIWRLQFPTCNLNLVYQDFPNLVSLESDTAEADNLLRDLEKDLREKNYKSAH